MSTLRFSQRNFNNPFKRLNSALIPRSQFAVGLGITVTAGSAQSFQVGSNTHVFFTSSANITVTQPGVIDYVIVAGGGGGAGWGGGGGGAGGLLTGTRTLFAGNTFTIIIGSGGTGTSAGVYPDTGKTDGANTIAFGLTAVGGGQGGQFSGHTQDQVDGGSGGGSGYAGTPGAGTNFPGPAQQGYPGSSFYGSYYGGGGGGAGESGYNIHGGNGAIISWLQPSAYTGSPVVGIGQVWGGSTYLGGGGSSGGNGSPTTTPGFAGLGGGGRGKGTSPTLFDGKAGNVNTGGGGGAADTQSPSGTSQSGGTSGGSGVVIIKYATPI